MDFFGIDSPTDPGGGSGSSDGGCLGPVIFFVVTGLLIIALTKWWS